jgi:hypothetical protein
MTLGQQLVELAQQGDLRAKRLLAQTKELAETVCVAVGDRRFLQPLIEAGLDNKLDLSLLKVQADKHYLNRNRLAELLESYR